MAYIFTFNMGWIIATAILGFGMGWISPISRSRSLSMAWSRAIVAAIVVLVVVAFVHVVPGRAGYLLDLGLVMIAAYLLSCAVGAMLRYWLLVRPAAS